MLNSGVHKSLKKGDLESFSKAAGGNNHIGLTPSQAGRSMKSEYDYGNKRKFVDILGNVNKKNTLTIDQLDNTFDNRNKNDTQSQRSKYSNFSLASQHRRNKTQLAGRD